MITRHLTLIFLATTAIPLVALWAGAPQARAAAAPLAVSGQPQDGAAGTGPAPLVLAQGAPDDPRQQRRQERQEQRQQERQEQRQERQEQRQPRMEQRQPDFDQPRQQEQMQRRQEQIEQRQRQQEQIQQQRQQDEIRQQRQQQRQQEMEQQQRQQQRQQEIEQQQRQRQQDEIRQQRQQQQRQQQQREEQNRQQQQEQRRQEQQRRQELEGRRDQERQEQLRQQRQQEQQREQRQQEQQRDQRQQEQQRDQRQQDQLREQRQQEQLRQRRDEPDRQQQIQERQRRDDGDRQQQIQQRLEERRQRLEQENRRDERRPDLPREERLDRRQEQRQDLRQDQQRQDRQEQRQEPRLEQRLDQRREQRSPQERRQFLEQRLEERRQARDRLDQRGPGPRREEADQRQPRVDQLRRLRRETVEEGGRRTIIREPGNRTIIREGNRVVIRHDETDRLRRAYGGAVVRRERRGADEVVIVRRPNGIEIVTVYDRRGNLVRRVRRDAMGREIILIQNVFVGGPAVYEEFVELPPPVIRIPREQYVVNVEDASQEEIYEALTAPPIERLDRSYTLDQVRRSPALRERVRRVDIDTITFDFGSWDLSDEQAMALTGVAEAINRAIEENPNEVFLVEGHTDAVGDELDNLTLSDRRAETVARLLTEIFDVPAENLTTQGYGEQYLKVNTPEPERENRRVTIRRITPLLNQEAAR